MSKYRITCTPSRLRRLDVALPLLALTLSLLCLPDAAKSHVSSDSLLLLWGIVTAVVVVWRYNQTPPISPCSWQVTEQGDMTDLSQTSPQSGHIASASRITWWGLYLVLNLKHSDRQRRLWVLKGEVSEQDYRRLCRLILQPKDA